MSAENGKGVASATSSDDLLAASLELTAEECEEIHKREEAAILTKPSELPASEGDSAAIRRSQAKVTAENAPELASQFTHDFMTGCASPDSEWIAQKTKVPGLVIHTRPSHFGPIHFSRGTLRIAKPAEEVWKFVADSQHLAHVDPYYKSSTVVQSLGPFLSLVHYKYKMPFPMYPRDFTTLEVNRQVDDTTYIAIACSVDATSIVPLDKKFVRGTIYASGYLVRVDPANPTGSILTSLTQADPGGYIPTRFINMDAQQQPEVLGRIRLFLETGKSTYGKGSSSKPVKK